MTITLHSSNLYEARKDRSLMRVLFSLTLRGKSDMRFHMHAAWGDIEKDYLILIAKLKNKIAGWALLVPEEEQYYANFYVARAFRRKGIGTILYNKAVELCNGRMYCSPWDETSASFYIKNKAKIGGTCQDTTSSNLMDIYFD